MVKFRTEEDFRKDLLKALENLGYQWTEFEDILSSEKDMALDTINKVLNEMNSKFSIEIIVEEWYWYAILKYEAPIVSGVNAWSYFEVIIDNDFQWLNNESIDWFVDYFYDLERKYANCKICFE